MWTARSRGGRGGDGRRLEKRRSVSGQREAYRCTCDESDDEADAGKDGFGPSAPFASRRVKAAGSRGAERTADQSREGLRGFAACMAEDDGYEEAVGTISSGRAAAIECLLLVLVLVLVLYGGMG